jgi:uncharacterized protein
MEKNMNPVILYHANCFDGMHAAAVAYSFLGESAEYHAVNYDAVKTDFHDRDIIFLDVVYKAPDMQRLIDQGNRIVVIDHHPDNLKEVEHLKLDLFRIEGESGASLAWEFFYTGQEMPLAIAHAKDYDLWTFNLPNTKAFVAQQGSFPLEIQSYLKLHELKGEDYEAFVGQGQAVLTYKASLVKAIAGWAVPIRLMNFSGYVVNGPYELASEIGNQICDEKNCDFSMIWFQQPNGKAKISLRATHGSAPQQIAKTLFGGGGHERASGAHCEMEKLMKLIENSKYADKEHKHESDCSCGHS